MAATTKLLDAADKFIKHDQWDAEEGKELADLEYGGAGYGGKKRPDLSNTQFFVDALKATGNDANSEAVKKALIFVSRCQNLETEHNTTPNRRQESRWRLLLHGRRRRRTARRARPTKGGLRSYGSMTYAGLKSMIFAGVTADDPRVKAAKTWIAKHYDLKSNPGMGEPGLYYYYHTFAKTLSSRGRGRTGGRRRQEAQLARRPDPRACLPPKGERLVGERRQSLAGRGREPRDGLRTAGAVVRQAKVRGGFAM